MKILLDSCVPYRAGEFFVGRDVTHASDIGFQNLRNGELIARAALRFEALITTDKKIRYEQNLAKLALPVLELNTRFTRLDDLRALIPHLQSALDATREYLFISVRPDGTLEKLGERAK